MADGNSKKKRRERHAGRLRGSEMKTGNRGGPRTHLSTVGLYLLTTAGKGPMVAAEREARKAAAKVKR